MIDLEKIQESQHLLDVLLQMEDVLDSLDLYVFENWYNGEIIDGPNIKRYWLDFTLKYAWDKQPDDKAAYRLMKHGIRVSFDKMRYSKGKEEPEIVEDEDDEEKVFLAVKISIPRMLCVQIADEELDFYDEEIDAEDVSDAKDSDIESEDEYYGDQEGDDDMNADAEGEAPDDQEKPQ
jgi:hypothetical protein